MIDTSKSMIYHIGNLNAQSERISYQMATGKAIDKGSDDAMLHYKLVNLEDKLRVTEDLNLNITKTRALNDTADMNMGETKIALENIKLDLMKALNDGMDRSDKLALATNLRGIRENLFDRANTQVDGEYIFSGSVTTKKTMVKDDDFNLNGKVDFDGDGFLRQIAVQPGSYRDRGVTGYDVSFYNGDSALANETLTFEEGERVIDENGYEWKLNGNKDKLQRYDHNGNLATDSDGNILDQMDVTIPASKNFAIDLGVGTNSDVQGYFTININEQDPVTASIKELSYTYNSDALGNYTIQRYENDPDNPPATTTTTAGVGTSALNDAQTMHEAFSAALSLDGFSVSLLDEDDDRFTIRSTNDVMVSVSDTDYQYDISATNELEATADRQSVKGTFEVTLPNEPEGRRLESKHNYFDDLNRIINALEGHSTKLDGTKSYEITDDLVDEIVRNGLEQTTFQHDATNIGHGELGGRNAVFNVAQEKIETQITHYNILIQEFGGADLAKLAMESKSLELTYQSLYTTISKMNQMSLVNFIK
jgi:flagellin-like hook-associated protein FlgL